MKKIFNKLKSETCINLFLISILIMDGYFYFFGGGISDLAIFCSGVILLSLIERIYEDKS